MADGTARSPLAIHSPEGIITAKQAHSVFRAMDYHFALHKPYCSFIETNPDLPLRFDGVITRRFGNRTFLTDLYEIKSRKTTMGTMRTTFENEWIMTWDKINESMKRAEWMCLGYVGVLYTVLDHCGLLVPIMNHSGELLTSIRRDHTATRRTCEAGSGQIVRENAFIDISGGIEFPVPSCFREP